jgi:hypothetical protein
MRRPSRSDRQPRAVSAGLELYRLSVELDVAEAGLAHRLEQQALGLALLQHENARPVGFRIERREVDGPEPLAGRRSMERHMAQEFPRLDEARLDVPLPEDLPRANVDAVGLGVPARSGLPFQEG